MQIKVVPHEMGACYLTAIRHRYILDIMEEVRCSVSCCWWLSGTFISLMAV